MNNLKFNLIYLFIFVTLLVLFFIFGNFSNYNTILSLVVIIVSTLGMYCASSLHFCKNNYAVVVEYAQIIISFIYWVITIISSIIEYYINISFISYFTYHLILLTVFAILFLLFSIIQSYVEKNKVSRMGLKNNWSNLLLYLDEVICNVELYNSSELSNIIDQLKALQDKLKYSDPTSSEESNELEVEIFDKVSKLKEYTKKNFKQENVQQEIETLLKELIIKVNARNNILKLSKR